MARRPKTPDDGMGGTEDERIIREAKDRFERANTWEAASRKRFLDDVKFVNGDSDNLYQWPDTVRQSRGIGTRDERPCLTVNKTQQHCGQIINDARQNKTSMKAAPVGNQATYEAAQIIEGLLRHIEYISNAEYDAYITAVKWQVWGGIGYWRIATDYADDDSFDLEIFLRPVPDPLTILCDPDIKQKDGSDMRWAFEFEDLPKDEFKEAFPKYADEVPLAPLGMNSGDSWLRQDHIRVAKYWRAVERPDRLVAIKDPNTGRTMIERESVLGKHLARAAMDDPATKTREIKDTHVEWFLIVGDKIADRGDWAGKYIPIVRVPGTETVIEGELDRKGHVRALKDPQRMYNYNASAEIEFGALQSKTPYTAPVAAIENLTDIWETANLINYSVLPWNHLDDDGNPIPPPERQQPPVSAPLYLQGMQTAAQDMMLVSGQYQENFGEQSNAHSGVAINARERSGDNATYHFIDHFAMAVQNSARQIIDLFPHVYDTKRVMLIYADDGVATRVTVDPQAAQTYLETQQRDTDTIREVLFNPKVGRYQVQAEVGPSWGTKRQEAANALGQIIGSNPRMAEMIGDVWFRVQDFPEAEEVAERFYKALPAYLKGEGPDPATQQLQAQLQTAQQLLGEMGVKLQKADGKAAHADDEAAVRAYEAVTKRLETILKSLPPPPPDVEAEMERDMALATHQTGLDMVAAEHSAGLQAEQAQRDADAA